MDYVFVTGKRVDSNLLYLKDEKQLFKINSKNRKKKIYMCYVKDCKSRVFIDNNAICYKVNNYVEHNHHDNQEHAYKQLKLINEIKSECQSVSALHSGACISVSEIFKKHCLG